MRVPLISRFFDRSKEMNSAEEAAIRRPEMEDDRKRILAMLKAGTVSVEEAESLLDALGSGKEEEVRAGQALSTAESMEETREELEEKREELEELAEKVAEMSEKLAEGAPGSDEDLKEGSFSNRGQFTLTRGLLSGMKDNSNVDNMGALKIAEDVPEELLLQKIGRFKNMGRVTGPGKLLGVLQRVCSSNMGLFEDSAGIMKSICNEGDTVITKDYLERLDDGTTFLNEGTVEIAEDVPEELLLQKIAEYENEGETRGPSQLLAALQSRCRNNEGTFSKAD
jgi:DNA-binding transcriptional MerR regulator